MPPATAADALEDDVDVTEDDQRGRKDRTVMEGHDQLVPLELPHLVGDGLHLKERVAVERERGRERKMGEKRGSGERGDDRKWRVRGRTGEVENVQ